MLELSPKQVEILQDIASRGFIIVAFPLYASAVGVRKGNCAGLLTPVLNGGLRLLGEPCCLIEGNLSVRIHRNSADWFVWKKQEIEATPERLAEVAAVRKELNELLCAPK